MLLYSFGGLRAVAKATRVTFLPPGIGEPDLLAASASAPISTPRPSQACLKELKEQCLYLHFDGVRYCFKKDPNVTLLVEQEAEAVARDDGRVRGGIRTMLEKRLAGRRAAVVWPAKSGEVPDRDAQFLIAYLPVEFATLDEDEQRRRARDLCEHCRNRPREFRNGLGLAVPAADQVESLRRAVRYLLAVERVKERWREHNLTDAQKSQLNERAATEQAAAESALLKLYDAVWLPASGDGGLVLDVAGMGGRPLQTTLDHRKRAQIHERLMELLTTVQRRIFGTLAPGKIVDLFRLGADAPGGAGIPTDRVVAGFFSFLGFPRLQSDEVVRKAIARGVETGLFGYATGRPELGDDGRYRLDRGRVAFQRAVADDEIDLDSGFLILPAAMPEKPASTPKEVGAAGRGYEGGAAAKGGAGIVREGKEAGDEGKPIYGTRDVSISFVADRDKLYNAWNALANLADAAGKITVSVTATSQSGLDEAMLENGVLEPLRELGLIDDQQD